MDNSLFQLKPGKGKNQKSASITIGGDFTINNITELKKSITDAIDAYDKINLSVNNPDNIDLTAIQLLISLQKSASVKNTELNLNFSVPEDLSLILEHSGFSFHLIKSNNQ
ncbi:MAG TPA: hypothetical protein VE912_11665 [Bacteroidales bacterium]|nr:hypothetical protein [Bacteroidales bacterium]